MDRNRDFSSTDASTPSPNPNSGNASPGPEPPTSPHSVPSPAFVPQSIPVPPDHIYDLSTFLKFQHAPEPSSPSPPSGMGCPPGIWKVACRLWRTMPEHMDRLEESGNLRDRLFADDSAAAASKVLHDRKLHHEVRGILGKVTEANLETMQRSLTDLPIRQSTEEEIHEVINVFFSKSTRPEDSRYTPLYVNLVVHLIDSIGTDRAASMIRKEIITQCKDTFLSASDDSKKLEEICAELSEEEAELERMKFTGKQKANIFFLGLMFVNKLVTEHIIISVLDGLCYTKKRRNRFPPDNDIINFIELLQTCGPHFSSAQNEKLEQYRTDMTALCQSHSQMRIKVLLQNCLETMGNNWIPLHGPKARRDHPAVGGAGMAASGSPNHSAVASPASPASNSMNFTKGNHQAPGSPFGRGSPLAQSVGPGSPVPPKPPVREEFWKAMDEYFNSKSDEELIAMIERLPHDQVVTYCADALGRYIITVRMSSERKGLGALFEELVKREIIASNVPCDSLLRAARMAIQEDLISDLPQYFHCWNMVISHGGGTFPATLHYEFLSLMIEYHSPLDQIQRFIAEVDTFLMVPPSTLSGNAGGGSSTTPTGPSGHSSVTSPVNGTGGLSESEEDNSYCRRMRERLHLLPAILRFNFPLLSGEGLHKEEQDKILRMNENSVEVKVFQELVDDEGDLQIAIRVVKENPVNAFPALSALFTFMRFNINGQWERLKSSIRKIFTAPQIVALDLLEDVFIQWQYLEAPAEEYVQFVQKVKQFPNMQKDLVERLKERLRSVEKRNWSAYQDVVNQLDGHPASGANGTTVGGSVSHHPTSSSHTSMRESATGGSALQRHDEGTVGTAHGVMPHSGGGGGGVNNMTNNNNNNNRRRKG